LFQKKAMRRRFFVDRFEQGHAVIRGDDAHHLARVLRAAPGQVYELSDGEALWLARIEGAFRDRVEFALVEQLPAAVPKLSIALLLSIVKFDRFEWALEKSTELGIAEIAPLAAARSEKSLAAAATKRMARWQKIVVEAAQQCRRLRAPALHPVHRPASAFSAEFLSSLFPAPTMRDPFPPLKILLSEAAEAAPLRTVLDPNPGSSCYVLAIGPEGGWTDSERSAARAAGFAEASLGSLILRTETAVVAALAAITYALGA
jgi:16S rRNA (uracil1498-N3)-methyltransferase